MNAPPPPGKLKPEQTIKIIAKTIECTAGESSKPSSCTATPSIISEDTSCAGKSDKNSASRPSSLTTNHSEVTSAGLCTQSINTQQSSNRLQSSRLARNRRRKCAEEKIVVSESQTTPTSNEIAEFTTTASGGSNAAASVASAFKVRYLF